MPQTHKVLGQSNPSSTTLTTLYVVPASTQAIASTITVANLGSTATTFRLAVRPSGQAISNQNYLVYDASIPANDTTTLTLGIALAASDAISVYAGNASLAFGAYGVEIS